MYKLHNKEFKTKEILKSYLIEIIDNQNGEVITSGDDFELIKEGIKQIPTFKEIKGVITRIRGERTVTKGNSVIYKIHFIINLLKRKREEKYEYVFLNTIITSIPPVKESTIEYVFKFGKYKGVNIQDVEEQYLRWISGPDSSLNPAEKKMITQYLKYGFIPFNPNHYSK
jgi:hypothetical protein